MIIFDIIKYLYNISTILLLFVIIYKIQKEKYLIITSLVFWCTFFYFCYIAFSCIFIEEINKNWNFSLKTINITRIIILFYNLFFSLFTYYCCYADKTVCMPIILKERYAIVYNIAKVICFFGTFVIIIAILQLIKVRKITTGFQAYFKIRESAGILAAKYHIRLFLYLLISSSFYLFCKNRKLMYFLPLLLIVLFETLAGQRTTAFVVLIYLYIIFVCTKKTLALKFIIPLLGLLLVGILFARAEALAVKINVLMIFGEFFETFTTIPYLIEYDLFGVGFNFERVISDYSFVSFIPGFLKVSLVSYPSTGAEMAKIIGRGYGLGSNFIFEQFFEFGYLGFFSCLFIPLLLFSFEKRLKGWGNLIIKIIFIFQMRLYIREGISQFMILFYIFLMYCGFFYFMKKDILVRQLNVKSNINRYKIKRLKFFKGF